VTAYAKAVKLGGRRVRRSGGQPPGLHRPAGILRASDISIVLIENASRFARDLIVQLTGMGGERLDTRNPTSKLMLTILAGVATWEREIMLERQREGIARAKSEGKYKGRPASIDAAEIKRLTGTMGPASIAKHLGIARSTVYQLLEVERQ
jgi:hypothetical protein